MRFTAIVRAAFNSRVFIQFLRRALKKSRSGKQVKMLKKVAILPVYLVFLSGKNAKVDRAVQQYRNTRICSIITQYFYMFNPLEKFDQGLIEGFRRKGIRYLVAQSYQAGTDEFFAPEKTPILLSHYVNSGLAFTHFQSLGDDRYKALIDLENETHRRKMAQILAPDSRYLAYSSLMGDPKGVERRANQKYRKQVRRYIMQNTSWTLEPFEKIKPHLQLVHGELFISIQRMGERIHLPLRELEKA